MSFSIRRLGPEDADAYRAFRLFMLEDAPKAFGDSVEEASSRPMAVWTADLSGTRAFFGGFAGGKLVAAANFLRESAAKASHRGWLLGVYVAPEARGSGLAGALIGSVLDHARAEVLQVHLGVGSYNTPAIRLYERAGFRITGTTPRSLLVGGEYIDEHEMVCFFDKDENNE